MGATGEMGEMRATTATGKADAAGQGDELIRRAPSGYLWNQAFSLWLFFSLFIFQLVLTRTVSKPDRGTFTQLTAAANFAIVLAALGLESAGSVYLPRALAEHGPAHGAAVALRLALVRLGATLLVAAGVLFSLPLLGHILTSLNAPGAGDLAAQLDDPVLGQHTLAVATYVIAAGMMNLLASLLTALLRTRVVFIAGGAAQLLTLALVVVFLGNLHLSVDSGLLAQTAPALLTSLVYVVALWRALRARPAKRTGGQLTWPMLKLGIAAWLADLPTGLLKAIPVAQLLALLPLAGLSGTEVDSRLAGFDVAFQMGHAAAFLFVAGLGGVGLAVMSAAYANANQGHLATAWRTVGKLQVVLAVPVVAFCVPHARAISVAFYGQPYAEVGPLLALFLVFNALVRLGGGGAHDAALYVIGKQRWVVLTRWASLGVLALGDLLLIPPFGVAGALAAVGLAQLFSELALLVLAWRALRRPYVFGFMARVLLAMTPALLFAALWRPDSLVGLFFSGLGYAAIFLVCLRVARPLDAEDRLLLDAVARPLRAALLPFVAPARVAAPVAVSVLATPTTRPLEPVGSGPLPIPGKEPR